MATCKVCWTCRGLFEQGVCGSKVKSHLQSCTGSSLPKDYDHFEYFVCNKVDFRSLNLLKDWLNKCGRDPLLSMNVAKILPDGLIKCLTVLNGNSSSGYSTKHAPKSGGNSNKAKASHEPLREDDGKFGNLRHNKSCQTVIHKSSNSNFYDIQDVSEPAANDIDNPSLKLTDASSDFQTSPNARIKHQCQNGNEFHNQITELNAPSNEIFQLGKILLAEEEEKLKTQCHVLKVEKESFFVCRLCSHKTKSDKLMLRHLNSHNDGHSFDCEPCAYSTIWRREWKQHLYMHEKNKISCSLCGFECWKKEMLDKHLASEHAEMVRTQETNKLQCGECDYVAKSMTVLKEHKRKHTGEVFTCIHEGCEFKSVYERSLQKHLKQKHAEEKTQICWVCGFQTRHASSLSKHMLLRHQEFKPYKCAQCPFRALYPSEVISHAKSKHLKQKRFSCPVCHFQTSYPLAIQKHVERHKGVKGFFCFLCGEVLESAVKIKRHLEEKHGCTDHRIMNESTSGKVKPNDYKMDTNLVHQIEDTYHMLVSKSELAERTADEATVRTDITLDIGSDILGGHLEPEAMSTENLMTKSLDQETSLYNNNSHARKGGNPMLSATTKDLDDMDTSLTEDSLFDLMSDFPRPPGLNRSQSASTLMFASFSPHLIDRPMTPDFFTDSPSVGSIFPNFSTRNLDSESLSLGGNFDGPSQTLSVPSSGIVLSASSSSIRGANPPSPVLPSFITSLDAGNSGMKQDQICMDVDSLLQTSVLSGLPQLVSCGSSGSNCPDPKLTEVSFVSSNSAFASLNTDFSPEIQAAVASIPSLTEADCAEQTDTSLTEESPFPVNVL